MKTTIEKVKPNPKRTPKLPFPKIVIDRKLGLIVLMREANCGTCIQSGSTFNPLYHYSTSWFDDHTWEDLAPDECVKLMN